MAATAKALSPTPPPRVDAPTTSGTIGNPLWLCAYFPELALEVLNLNLNQPVACSVSSKGQIRIHATSAAARQAGVEPAMAPAAALALCPSLLIKDRDPPAERQAMLGLAEIALNFSPWVSLDQPNCLLLEIRSCLTLFGGAQGLIEKIRPALQNGGHRPVLAVSPSPTASELWARLGLETIIPDRQALRSALGPLSISALALEDKVMQRLLRAGIRQFTDLWRLPRDGLAKRYGSALLQQLDSLAGRQTPVLPAFHLPPRFQASVEMPIELERIEHFFPAIVQLAGEFGQFLQTRDATALGISLDLHHHSRPATRLELNFRAGNRDPDHWRGLLHEKLERSPLPAPVLAITLSSDTIAPFQPECFSLFDDAAESGSETEWQAILDQLQARLGHKALKFPVTHADHRPERAMSCQGLAADVDPCLAQRPLWLLPKPKPIQLAEIRVLSTAERIESGWWDDQPIRRDYHVAVDGHGRKLWVYRDLSARRQWYVHGLFG